MPEVSETGRGKQAEVLLRKGAWQQCRASLTGGMCHAGWASPEMGRRETRSDLSICLPAPGSQ